jgi:hypothetical protein
MKVKVNRVAADDWKPVTVNGTQIGAVRKVGGDWRARVGKTEYLGNETPEAAVDTVLAKQPEPKE